MLSVPAIAPAVPLASSPASAAGLTTQLEMHLQRAGAKSGYEVLSSRSVPLRNDDKIQLRVRLNHAAYLYLYWYDALGTVTRLWPPDLSRQEPTAELWEPRLAADGDDQIWHVIGRDRGLEMAVAAASTEPLPLSVLDAFEHVQVRMLHATSQGELVAFARDGGQGQLDTSSQGLPLRSSAGRHGAALLLDSSSASQLVTLLPRSPEDSKRALIGRIQSPKGRRLSAAEDFEQYLQTTFPSYMGLVFPHE
jgi:hypothetical protein